MNKFKVFVYHNMNAPKAICNHMLGHRHSMSHRLTVGAIIMFFGVSIAKTSAALEGMAIHLSGDVLGYFLHAVGAIPFIKLLDKEDHHE